MKMYFMRSVVLFSLIWLSVVRSDSVVDFSKCEHDAENCEQFSSRRNQPNVSIVNNSSEFGNLKTEAQKDLSLVENQIIFEQAHIQENGNVTNIIGSIIIHVIQ